MDKKPSTEEIRRRMEGKEFLAGQNVSSIDSERRIVDILFFTGVDVPRMDYWTGKKYILRFDPTGADLSLLNNGAPVLDNHSSWSGSAGQKGKVEKAWRDGDQFKATLRFSKRKSVDELWGDIEDRITTKFSMGVEILKSKKLEEDEQEILFATSWRPFELSIAPIPADFGTTTLSAEERGATSATSTTSVVITNTQMGINSPEETVMPEKVETTGTGAQTSSSGTLTAEQMYQEALEAARQKAVVEELARVKRIREVCRWCNLEDRFADKYVDDHTSAADFQTIALNEQAKRGIEYGPERSHVSVKRDETHTRRELMAAAITGLLNPKERKEDPQSPFSGLTIKEIAAESVRQERGLRRLPTMTQVCELAMQATADFASVLEVSSRKQMLRMYELANPSYKIWTKRSTTPDFKTMTRVRLSEAPTLLKVPEGAQITVGMMQDSKESYSLATYGRGVSFTRQMLINDDLGAFNDLIGQFGAQAARLENKTVYAILTANAAMADAVTLFDDTNHHNTGTGALGNTAFDSMFGKMAIQKGLDGVSILNIRPRFVIVPMAKESTARANVLATGPNLAASSQNWFAGRLEPVGDPELDATSTTAWYGAADPDLFPGIEHCYLQGAEGPQFIRKENESGILGIQFYCFLDFAAKAVDWRPLYYSTGS